MLCVVGPVLLADVHHVQLQEGEHRLETLCQQAQLQRHIDREYVSILIVQNNTLEIHSISLDGRRAEI